MTFEDQEDWARYQASLWSRSAAGKARAKAKAKGKAKATSGERRRVVKAPAASKTLLRAIGHTLKHTRGGRGLAAFARTEGAALPLPEKLLSCANAASGAYPRASALHHEACAAPALPLY